MIFLPCIIFSALLGQVFGWPVWIMADLSALLCCLVAYIVTKSESLVQLGIGGAIFFVMPHLSLSMIEKIVGENPYGIEELARALASPTANYIVAFTMILFASIMGTVGNKA